MGEFGDLIMFAIVDAMSKSVCVGGEVVAVGR